MKASDLKVTKPVPSIEDDIKTCEGCARELASGKVTIPQASQHLYELLARTLRRIKEYKPPGA